MSGELEPRPEQVLSDREKVDRFFSAFDGKAVENHQDPPKKVKLFLTRPSHKYLRPRTPSNSEYLLQFEGYELMGTAPLHTNRIGNFAWFSVDYKNKKIILEYVSLEHPDLKSSVPSKGVRPNLRRLMGQAFPEGFFYLTEIGNDRSRKQFMSSRLHFLREDIDQQEVERQAFENYVVRERIAAGFNSNRVIFVSKLEAEDFENDEDEYIDVYIKSQKIEGKGDFAVIFDYDRQSDPEKILS